MPIKKNELINILFSNNIPLIEYILKQVSIDHDLSYEDLEKKYIKPFKYTKKRNTNKKGRKTNYSMFLADKNVEKELKERYPNMSFGELSKEKSKVWKVMSKQDKEKYKTLAEEYNQKLKTENKNNDENNNENKEDN